MPRMLLLFSALLLGFLHGLGADHLMAIAALAVGERTGEAARARAFGVAVRFACGHAMLLALGASAVAIFGWTVPAAAERGGERLAGLLLIGLGALGLWAVATGRVYGHVHGDRDDPRPHWHLHVGRTERHPRPAVHVSHLPTLVGALFAVGSLRALSLLAPFGAGPDRFTLPILLGLVALFGVGVLASMALFGVVLARAVSTRFVSRLGTGASALTSAASLALGAYWIVRT
jgi:nickel/cobalt exporter